MIEFEPPPIPDLQGRVNYDEWAECVRIHFAWFELDNVVVRTTVPPAKDAPEKERQEYRRKQIMAYSIMRRSMSPVIDFVRNSGYEYGQYTFDPRLLWIATSKAINRLSVEGRHNLVQELVRIDQQNYDDLRAYVDRFHYLNNQLREVGIELDMDVLESVLLEGLKTYDPDWVKMLMMHRNAGMLSNYDLMYLVTQKANEQVNTRESSNKGPAVTALESSSTRVMAVKTGTSEPTPAKRSPARKPPQGMKRKNPEDNEVETPAGKRAINKSDGATVRTMLDVDDEYSESDFEMMSLRSSS